MRDGKCNNNYPCSFSTKTIQCKDSYPIYRWRDDKQKVFTRNVTLYNHWVVPYNPYLLTRYNCHINVKVCSSIKAVKYLYKHIYKGNDRIAVYIVNNSNHILVDEIQQFQDARWILAQEAIWRIFEFELNEIYPTCSYQLTIVFSK